MEHLQNISPEDRFIRAKMVCEITSLSYTTIWRLERAGKFPKRIRLSESRVAWLHSEVIAWCNQKYK